MSYLVSNALSGGLRATTNSLTLLCGLEMKGGLARRVTERRPVRPLAPFNNTFAFSLGGKAFGFSIVRDQFMKNFDAYSHCVKQFHVLAASECLCCANTIEGCTKPMVAGGHRR